MGIRAIIFGATGMVGEGVLLEALQHEQIDAVLAVGRRSCEMRHQKLEEVLHADFFDVSSLEQRLEGYDACFFCLGVTSVGKKEAEYTRLTHTLTLHVAGTLARLNPAMTFCYISGTGTDGTEKGRTMWARVKGRTENDLTKLPFKAVYNFRPGFIKPIAGQKHAYGISKALGLFYPALKLLFPKYVCTLHDLALAMIRVSTVGSPVRVLENRDIAREAAGGK
jgi:uncharacterized protein YbjT (DUF2867 family)